MWAAVTPENVNIRLVATEINVRFVTAGKFSSLGLF